MDLSLTSIKTWATEHPLYAAGAGLGIVAVVALAVSEKARKMVGLSGATSSRKALSPHKRNRRPKAKSERLR